MELKTGTRSTFQWENITDSINALNRKTAEYNAYLEFITKDIVAKFERLKEDAKRGLIKKDSFDRFAMTVIEILKTQPYVAKESLNRVTMILTLQNLINSSTD